jgi:4'-phosphopantetheinyl transferase EntD
VCAIFVLRSGELLEMDERPFDREKELQRYLAEHPDLLSAGAPRRRATALAARKT